jgi:hypothetical protein
MNTSFLRELAENINLSYRSHAETDRETLVNLLDKKISPEKASVLFKMYLSCVDAKEVAELIRPKGMEEIVIAVKRFFKLSTECLYEVTVSSRRCDIVIFVNGSIVAIEVKSAQDQLKNAVNQLSDYSTWANKVYLAYDSKHKRAIEKLGIRELNIGLLEFKSGKMQMIKDSSYIEHESSKLLSLVTYEYLAKIAKSNMIGTRGKKVDIAKALCFKLSEKEILNIFRNFLKNRTLR